MSKSDVMSDIVFIEGLSVQASIGVFDWEKKIKQTLIFDIELTIDLTTAGQSDNLDNTVCYAQVSELVNEISTAGHIDLLEALADKVITSLFARFPISAIKLRLAKPGAVPNTKSVGIQIHRNRTSVTNSL